MLLYSQRFYASLSDIKTEVEAVLREGRQQVEEGLVEDQITVSAELDAMKALYNRVWNLLLTVLLLYNPIWENDFLWLCS